MSTAHVNPFFTALWWIIEQVFWINSPKSVFSGCISKFLASILEKSRMSLMIAKRFLADESTVLTYSVCSSLKSVNLRISLNPITPFNGVRSSWLMVERNSLLALSAFLASSILSLSSSFMASISSLLSFSSFFCFCRISSSFFCSVISAAINRRAFSSVPGIMKGIFSVVNHLICPSWLGTGSEVTIFSRPVKRTSWSSFINCRASGISPRISISVFPIISVESTPHWLLNALFAMIKRPEGSFNPIKPGKESKILLRRAVCSITLFSISLLFEISVKIVIK